MESKTFLVVLFISVIIILTAIPIFYIFFNFSPTGFALRQTTNLCKIGCENEFIECLNKCENETCKENCRIQRGKCLFYC